MSDVEETGLGTRLGHAWRRALAAAGVMVVALGVSNLANYVYNLVMGRQLGPDRFGELSALLGVLMILSIASQAVQTLVARYVTEMHQNRGDADVIPDFVSRLSRRATVLGLVSFLVWIPLSWPLSRVLQINEVLPVLVTGSALILGFTLPVIWGALQGRERFGSLGLNMVIIAVGRLIFGVILVALGAGVAGAVGALTIATMIALIVVMPKNLHARPLRRVGPTTGTLLRYAYPTLAGVLAWTMLTNLDVVFVKGMATPTEAGYYGSASTIGKIVLFLPLAVGLVIFPKGAAHHVAGRDSRHLVRRSGQALVALSLLFVAVAWVEGEAALRLMFGTDYLPATRLVVPIVVAMSCFSIANVLLFYYLATHQMRFTVFLFVTVAFQVVGLAALAADPLHAAWVQMAMGLFVLVVNEIFFVPIFVTIRIGRRGPPSGPGSPGPERPAVTPEAGGGSG